VINIRLHYPSGLKFDKDIPDDLTASYSYAGPRRSFILARQVIERKYLEELYSPQKPLFIRVSKDGTTMFEFSGSDIDYIGYSQMLAQNDTFTTERITVFLTGQTASDFFIGQGDSV
jgi:hypothetical protein